MTWQDILNKIYILFIDKLMFSIIILVYVDFYENLKEITYSSLKCKIKINKIFLDLMHFSYQDVHVFFNVVFHYLTKSSYKILY